MKVNKFFAAALVAMDSRTIEKQVIGEEKSRRMIRRKICLESSIKQHNHELNLCN